MGSFIVGDCKGIPAYEGVVESMWFGIKAAGVVDSIIICWIAEVDFCRGDADYGACRMCKRREEGCVLGWFKIQRNLLTVSSMQLLGL